VLQICVIRSMLWAKMPHCWSLCLQHVSLPACIAILIIALTARCVIQSIDATTGTHAASSGIHELAQITLNRVSLSRVYALIDLACALNLSICVIRLILSAKVTRARTPRSPCLQHVSCLFKALLKLLTLYVVFSAATPQQAPMQLQAVPT
jgi:hypothetical protein